MRRFFRFLTLELLDAAMWCGGFALLCLAVGVAPTFRVAFLCALMILWSAFVGGFIGAARKAWRP